MQVKRGTAASGKINVILTRNVKDYVNSELGVMTPESYLKIL